VVFVASLQLNVQTQHVEESWVVLYNMIKYWCHLTKIGEKSSLLYDSYIVCEELESHVQEY
jgi:hypothetical protein